MFFFLHLGITFVDLYTRCREKFLVNSDTNLRAQLTEFKDHKLIKVKKVRVVLIKPIQGNSCAILNTFEQMILYCNNLNCRNTLKR